MLRSCTETLSSMRAVCQKLHAACVDVYGGEMRQLCHYLFLNQFQFHMAAYPVSREERTMPSCPWIQGYFPPPPAIRCLQSKACGKPSITCTPSYVGVYKKPLWGCDWVGWLCHVISRKACVAEQVAFHLFLALIVFS